MSLRPIPADQIHRLMITPFGELPNSYAARMSLAEQHEWLTRRISRRGVLGAGLAAAAGTLLWTQPAQAQNSAVLGARVAYGPDPRSSMIVSFAVAGPVRTANVRALRNGQEATAAGAAIELVAGSPTRYCHATLHGLHSDTDYDYTIELDGQPVKRARFRTAFPSSAAFRFTAFGDQGVGSIAGQMVNQVGKLAPRFHLFLGDLSYADSSGLGGPGDAFNPDLWDRWLREISPVAKATPWMYAIGNHEMEPGFGLHGYAGVLQRVPMGGASPVEVPVASTFTIGNVGFVGLDSNDASYEIPANRGWTGGAQTRWLEATLKRLRAPGGGVDFVVVFMHHPAYGTNASHGSEGGIWQEWVPLFDRYSVDLVLSGHSHAYERVRPVRNGRPVDSSEPFESSRGTTYITAGGGGAAAYSRFYTPGYTQVWTGSGLHREPAPWELPATRTAEHAVVCVDVSPAAGTAAATMRIRALSADGSVLDETTLQRAASSNDDLQLAALAGGGLLVAAGSAAAIVNAHRGRHRAADNGQT